MGRGYHLTTKDLVTISVLASLGGVLSTYIGYLGNLVNRLFGTPFGAGQFMAGLHVVWILLAVGLTRKKGVGTLTGLLKGSVELFMGGTHGVVILVVSGVQGLLVDLLLFRDRSKERRHIIPYSIAGGVSSASNVLIFQLFYFSGVMLEYPELILILVMLSAGSGIVFGGWLTLQIMFSLDRAGLVQPPGHGDPGKSARKRLDRRAVLSLSVTGLLLASFTVGAAYYYTFVHVPPGREGIDIVGDVENSYTFHYPDMAENETVVRAELVGSVSYEPIRNYTGIPVRVILERAGPEEDADSLTVKAKDGYSAEFDIGKVMSDGEMIVVRDGGDYRLIAAGYDGAYWVRDIYEMEVS